MFLSAHECLTIILADRASWYDVASYPATTVCRLVCHIADSAAADPAWWSTLRARFFNPSAPIAELARLTGATQATVKRNLTRYGVRVADAECADAFAEPAPVFELPAAPPTTIGETARHAVALADFAAASSAHYRALRYMYATATPKTANEIAEFLGCSEPTARRYMAVPDDLTESFNIVVPQQFDDTDDDDFEAACRWGSSLGEFF